MRGFIFTIDSMMALLFAFYIISIPSQMALLDVASTKISDIALANIAIMHQNTHIQPIELMARVGLCGEYSLLDGNMNVKASGSTCSCSANPYYYPYAASDGGQYLVSLKACQEGKEI